MSNMKDFIEKNKKVILLMISILTVVTVLINSTYSLLFKTDETELQSYTTGILEITSDTVNNSITLTDALPVPVASGEVSTPYTFKITNTGNLNYQFDLKLLSTTIENQIDSQYIIIKVNDNAPVTLGNEEEVPNGIILSDQLLAPGDSIEVVLRVWLDEYTPNSQLGKTFSAKVVSDGYAVYTTDLSNITSPDLVDGMIPVTWDVNNNLVKADVENSNSWYNYSSKRWANAVLVKEHGSGSAILEEEDKEVDIDANNIFDGSWYIDSDITNSNNNNLTLSFRTGDSGGTLDIAYIIESSDGSDVSMITGDINGSMILETVPDEDSNTVLSLSPNTDYVLKFNFYIANSSILSYANVYFYEYPTDISNVSLDSGNWRTTYSVNAAESYTVDNGQFLLDDYVSYENNNSDVNNNSNLIGLYVCSDGVSTSCSEMYEINETNLNKVVNANKYVVGDAMSRSDYQNASAGTIINENDILAYYVWIPRFKYTVLPSGAATADTMEPQTIDVVFEESDEVFSDGTLVGEYRTHPAFWWDDNNDNVIDEGEMKSGFWIGKFETGGTASAPLIKPDIISLGEQTVSEQFETSQIFGSSSYGVNSGVIDAHMIKNSEWGAVAYLSHSQFGANREVYINNSSGYYTGRSGGNVGGSTAINNVYTNQSSTSQSNTYGFYTWDGYLLEYGTNTKSSTKDLSKVASTTGNITGVYDMSGGSLEYVMGYYQAEENTVWGGTYEDVNNAGFSSQPESKYYDNYTSRDRTTACDGGICFGHALSETNNWYDDFNYFISGANPWFVRGGNYANENGAGIFNFGNNTGDSDLATRSVLITQ